MRGNHCKFPILLFSQCCVLCCCYFITATWWNVSPLPGNNRCLSEPLKHFPSLRGLKGPGPGLPEVKIKHLSNEENLLLLPLLHTERGRELVTGSSVGGTFCLETINTQQVMPWDRDRMSRMIALEMFAVNTVPFITFLSKFGKTNNQTKPGHLCCAVLASWRLTLAVDLILKIFNDPLFCTSVRLHFLPLPSLST